MSNYVVKNVSKGFLKKLLSKDRIESVTLTETGFTITSEKQGEIPVSFELVTAVKTRFYLDKMTPYRTVVILTDEPKEYSLDVSPQMEEIDNILKHYASHQLKGELPEKIEDIDLVLQRGLNNYSIRLKSGCLIVTKAGQETSYPMEELEYYRVDKPSNTINLKFKDKKLFVTLSATEVTNIWLTLRILETFSTKK